MYMWCSVGVFVRAWFVCVLICCWCVSVWVCMFLRTFVCAVKQFCVVVSEGVCVLLFVCACMCAFGWCVSVGNV